ncbi:hypothetical protein BAL199_16258 [alpha proteobacterium BAL199]|jgi:hypothetical protein|nr:hypothetical protein BAL199_16258 [alpha proteobacterium BAL199]
MTDNDSKSKRQQDRDLDQELEDSFPASDPPSNTPGTGSGAPDHDKDGKAKKRPTRPTLDPKR